MQINNLRSNIIMVFRLDFKVFQVLQKATLTDCLFCITKLFLLKPLIMLLFPDLITVLQAKQRSHLYCSQQAFLLQLCFLLEPQPLGQDVQPKFSLRASTVLLARLVRLSTKVRSIPSIFKLGLIRFLTLEMV